MNRKNPNCLGEVQKCSDDILLVRDKTAMCYLVMQVCAKKAKDEWPRIYNSQFILATLWATGICKSTEIM